LTFVLDKDFEGTSYEQLTEEEKKMLTGKLDRILDELLTKVSMKKRSFCLLKKSFLRYTIVIITVSVFHSKIRNNSCFHTVTFNLLDLESDSDPHLNPFDSYDLEFVKIRI
jgi:hypothetical protein